MPSSNARKLLCQGKIIAYLNGRLFDRYAFCQVTGFVHVATANYGDMIGQKL